MEMKYCGGCNDDRNIEEFGNNKSSKDGKQSQCRSCMSKLYRKSRLKKSEHYKNVSLERNRNNTKLFREWKEERGCKFCNETFGPCLQLHHTDSNEKENEVANLAKWSFTKMVEEAEKCIVVCGNCHTKIHHGLIGI